MSKVIYKELAAFHPGYYVHDIIEDMEITQSEFAKRVNTTDKTLSRLLDGQIDLSEDMANNLSRMTGMSLESWLNLQKNYECKRCEIEQKQKLNQELAYLKLIDYNYFVKLKVLPLTKDPAKRCQYLQQYLHVSTLKILERPDLLVECKTSIAKVNTKNIVNANAWIQTGINFARKINCENFDSRKLHVHLEKIAAMSTGQPADFYPPLKKLLADCGIALVALPYLKYSGLNGAVKWLTDKKVLLLINDRGKDAGKFWFAMFHELKHILQEKRKTVYLTFEDSTAGVHALSYLNPENEAAADKFARAKLVPEAAYQAYVARGCFDAESICAFASSIKRAPAIVLGRLQHDELVPWSAHSHLKTTYHIVTD